MTRFTVLVAAIAVLLGSSLAQAQLQDRLYGSSGTATSGTVSKMTPNEVGLGSRNYPVNEIQRLEFGGEPRDLTAARQQMRQGQYEDTLASIRKIDATKVKRSYITQDIKFYEAYAMAQLALRGNGDKSAAGRKLGEFRKAYPQSYHYFKASEMYGDLAGFARSERRAVLG